VKLHTYLAEAVRGSDQSLEERETVIQTANYR
jgi:hypothetical protein